MELDEFLSWLLEDTQILSPKAKLLKSLRCMKMQLHPLQ